MTPKEFHEDIRQIIDEDSSRSSTTDESIDTIHWMALDDRRFTIQLEVPVV